MALAFPQRGTVNSSPDLVAICRRVSGFGLVCSAGTTLLGSASAEWLWNGEITRVFWPNYAKLWVQWYMVLIYAMIQYTIRLSNMVCWKIPYLVWWFSHFKSRLVREIPIASHVWYSRIAYPEIPHFRTHQSLLGEGKGQLHGAGSVISFSWGCLRAITVEKCISVPSVPADFAVNQPHDCGKMYWTWVMTDVPIEHHPTMNGIWSIMATIRWCLIFPKWDIYQPLLNMLVAKNERWSTFYAPNSRTAADSTWFVAVEVVSPWLFGVQALGTVNDHLLPLSNKQLHRFSFSRPHHEMDSQTVQDPPIWLIWIYMDAFVSPFSFMNSSCCQDGGCHGILQHDQYAAITWPIKITKEPKPQSRINIKLKK